MTPPEIKNLIELIDFGFDISESIADALKDDGKVSLFETVGLLKNAGSARDAFSGLGQVDDELKILAVRPDLAEFVNRHLAKRLEGRLTPDQGQRAASLMGLFAPVVNVIASFKKPAADAPVAPAEAA